MHISEIHPTPNTILTKCTKMTEDGTRRHGMNGNADGTFKEECPKSNYSQGGRLKFFKDGKFILELERAREGERVSWVSVPRKTFWPPQGIAVTTPTYRQESSTSLSVSDDNSSIQSSPWQRDHSWKQTTPRQNISKELTLYFWRPKSKRFNLRSKKRRKPYSTAPELECNDKVLKETISNSASNNKVQQACNKPKDVLIAIVQKLSDKNQRTSTPTRADMVVSPRKRFLREMEKDKPPIEDNNCQKRSRNKQQTATTTNQTFCNNSAAGSLAKVGSPVNGVLEDTKPPRNCSSNYSITSLLADDRNIKRSPSNSPSHFSPVTQPHYSSPTSDDRWYSESVDRLRSIELSQQHAEKRGAYPPYPSHHQSYIPTYYPFPCPPYFGAAPVYGRGYIVPPVYPSMQQMSMRQEAPSCSWAGDPTTRDADNKDETVADMPLNLSKHAG